MKKLLLAICTLIALSASAQVNQLQTFPAKTIGGFLYFPSIPSDGPAYGYQPLFLGQYYQFTANARNTGTAPQPNVNGRVRIFNSSRAVIHSVPTGSMHPNLQPGAVTHLGTMNPWYPSFIDTYTMDIASLSDSIGPGLDPADIDSLTFHVTDSTYSTDFGNYANSIGYGDLGTTNYGIASFFHLPFDLDAHYVEIGLGPNTETGGVLEVYIIDTAGFSNNYNFTSNPIAFRQHSINAQDSAKGYVRLDFGDPAFMNALVSQGYYVFVHAFTINGVHPIHFVNDTTVVQPPSAALVFDGQNWTDTLPNGGSSLLMNSWYVRLGVTRHTVSLSEESMSGINVFPNPANDQLFIETNGESSDRSYVIYDLEGKAILFSDHQYFTGLNIDISKLTVGVYILEITGVNGQKNLIRFVKM